MDLNVFRHIMVNMNQAQHYELDQTDSDAFIHNAVNMNREKHQFFVQTDLSWIKIKNLRTIVDKHKWIWTYSLWTRENRLKRIDTKRDEYEL